VTDGSPLDATEEQPILSTLEMLAEWRDRKKIYIRLAPA